MLVVQFVANCFTTRATCPVTPSASMQIKVTKNTGTQKYSSNFYYNNKIIAMDPDQVASGNFWHGRGRNRHNLSGSGSWIWCPIFLIVYIICTVYEINPKLLRDKLMWTFYNLIYNFFLRVLIRNIIPHLQHWIKKRCYNPVFFSSQMWYVWQRIQQQAGPGRTQELASEPKTSPVQAIYSYSCIFIFCCCRNKLLLKVHICT